MKTTIKVSVIVVLMSLFCISNSWARESLAADAVIPSPVCIGKNAPEFCGWSKEKVMAQEQRIVARATEQVQKIILPSLNRAVWVSYYGGDETNPLTEAYCSNKLTALREGRARYFPVPQAKSSEIGVQMLKQQREEKAKLVGCDKDNKDNYSYSILSESWALESYTEWLYALPYGFARLHLNPANNNVSFESVFNQCNDGIHVRDSKINAKEPLTVPDHPGYFTEQTVGLVEIDGELFGLEGGVLRMDDGNWRYSIYGSLIFQYGDGVDLQPVEQDVEEKKALNSHSGTAHDYTVTTSLIKTKYKFSAAQQKSFDKNNTWLGRIFLLYPLNPPWRKYYRQLQIPEDEPSMEDGYSAYSKPCMWNIPD